MQNCLLLEDSSWFLRSRQADLAILVMYVVPSLCFAACFLQCCSHLDLNHSLVFSLSCSIASHFFSDTSGFNGKLDGIKNEISISKLLSCFGSADER